MPNTNTAEISEIGFELFDRPREECGVLGIRYNERGHEAVLHGEIDPYQIAYTALVSQANRGRQNTGLASSVDGKFFDIVTGEGGPEKAFNDGEDLKKLPFAPKYLVGHNRYTTVGGANGAQPVHFPTDFGDMVLAGNGEFSNHEDLSEEARPYDWPSDYWMWGSRVADEIDGGFTLAGAMIRMASISEGAYSIAGMHDQNMVLMRDPHGVRPLFYGRIGEYGWASASETPTLEKVGVDIFDIREVPHGEVIVIDDKGPTSLKYAEAELAFCSMEKIYLSSILDKRVRAERHGSGFIMAEESPVEADLVLPIMGSALMAAAGFADALDIHLDIEAIAKKRGASRNFMEYMKLMRDLKKNPKHILTIDHLEDKRVVVVDDSVFRGDTLKGLLDPIIDVAAETHIRIASPRITKTCDKGVAIKTPEELIFNQISERAFVESLGTKKKVASYHHLSMGGLIKAYGRELCTDCFTDGLWPVKRPTMRSEALQMANRPR